MSIKFPDLQVLVSRTHQIPKVLREGDPTGAAGRLTPEVLGEYEERPRKVRESERREKLRNKKDRNSNNKSGTATRKNAKGSNFDVKA